MINESTQLSRVLDEELIDVLHYRRLLGPTAILAFPGYIEKYGREIESLGWTPDGFSAGYRAGMRVAVTRIRYRGLCHLLG